MDMSKQKENVISYYKTMSLNTCVLEKQKWDKEGKNSDWNHKIVVGRSQNGEMSRRNKLFRRLISVVLSVENT